MTKTTQRISLLLTIFFAFLGQMANAQVANYVFSQSAGTYTPITGGTVLGTPGNDDNNFGTFPIGFNFTYNGVVYTQFGVNANGFITLGTIPTNSYVSLSAGTSNNVVSAFNYDLQSDATTGDLQYSVVGTAPNRTLVVQWTNYDSYQAVNNGDSWSFQIRLTETSNQVAVVYGTMTSDATSNTPQVGLRGATSADFNNRTTTTDWSASTAGLTNTATMTTSSTVFPASGQTFTWSPPPPPTAPATLTFTSVTTTGMVLNWVDSSTNETGFQIYRSLDNITYTYIGTVPSTSSASTGTAYTFNQVGLSSNTLYYYQVYSYNPTLSTPLSGSQATLPGTLCGTSSIGPTGTYPTITAAVAAAQSNGVACPVIWELQAGYLSSAEPAFPVIIPALGLSATNTITLRPEAGATGLSITSGSLTQTIRFDNCSYFTIDGRPAGLGTTSELTLENTALSGSAALFFNDASYNTLKYLTVKGVNNTTSSGVITFGSSLTNGLGALDNVITDCNIYDGLTTPANLIYSLNSTSGGAFNRTTVTNCNLYNFFNATVISSAIRTDAGNSGWTITNNSIFQAATRTYTTANIHDGILINNASGTGYTITGNSIGGTAPLCGGTAMTMTGTIATRFFGINLNLAGAGTTSLVQNNTIQNINLTTSSGSTAGIVIGINISGTGGNITVNGNTIGSSLSNNNIVATTSTTAGIVAGIVNSASGNVAITNNNIGGVTVNGSTATISTSFTGINTSGGVNTITGNTIGSTTLADNVLTATSTGTTAGVISGIICSSSLTNNISNNTIQNVTNRYSGTSTSGLTRGILASSGINTINGNTIKNLSNLSPENGSGLSSSVIGIALSSTTAGVQTVSNNTINKLSSGSGTGTISMAGIVASPSTSSIHKVFNNTISAISAPLNTAAVVINGIAAIGGTSTYYNNMIVLGLDALGDSITAAQEYNGILKSATTDNKFYFNSVHIAGRGVAAGTANTYAFRRTGTAIDTAKNNVFVNTRSNAAAGTATHNSYGLNATTTFTSDNNDIWGNGTGWQAGVVGATPYNSLATWKAGTALDASSATVNPNFISATNLHINNAITSSLESKAVVIGGISTDIDVQNRPGPSGSVNGGGTLPDMGADEFDGIPVTLDMGAASLALPLNSGCRTAADTVRVTIKNYSTQTIHFAVDSVTVSCSVSGPNPTAFSDVVLNTDSLVGGATMTVTFSTAYNMSAVGSYVFTASAVVTGDGATSNDAMSATTINNNIGTASGTTNTICAFNATTLSLTGAPSGATIQWQETYDTLGTWTNVAGATTTAPVVTPTDTTFYRALVCGNPTNIIAIKAQFVDAPTASPVTRCGPGQVTLSASGNGTLNWYAAASGGVSLDTGYYYSPTVTDSTTFYVAASGSGAQNTTVPGGNTWNQYTSVGSFQTTTITGASMVFDALQNVTIATIDMYPSATIGSSFTIEVRQSSGSGALIASYTGVTTVQNTGTPTVAQTVPVNFVIPAGTNYVIGFSVNPNTWRGNVTNFPYPYTLPGYFNIQGASFGTSPGNTLIYQYYLYNFVISTGCESQRVAVPVAVTPAPAVTLTAVSPSICTGGSSTLTAASANSNYIYTWSPSASLSASTGASVTATPSASTLYSVTANDANTGCQISKSVSVVVNPLPIVNASSSASIVCPGTPVTLNGSVVNDFVIDTGTLVNTTNTYPAPYGNWYWGAKHQILISASELAAAGVAPGNINGLVFELISTNAVPLTGFEIQMAPTSVTSLSAFVTGSFTVVSPAATFIPRAGSNIHTFTTPFNWDGVSNIVVQTCFNNASFTANGVFKQTATSYASTIYYREDAATVCANTITTASFNQRPNITFVTSPNYTYSWTPTGGVTNPDSLTAIAYPTSATSYVFKVTNNNTGCFASDTVQISTYPDTGSFTQTICANEVYTFNGVDLNTPGAYVDTLVSTFGCDSFVTLYLNVLPTATGAFTQTICANEVYTFNGVDLNTAGTYLDTLSAANGCDSVVTLTLNVLPTATGAFTQTICANEVFTFNGVDLNTAGTYLDTLSAANGCDSVVTLTLNVLPTATGAFTQTICANQTYSFNGATLNTAGTYLDTLQAANGCDSVVTLTLNVLPTATGAFTQTICANQTFTFNGVALNAAGTYLDTLQAANGCDSVVTLTLNVLPTATGAFTQTICANQTFTFNGATLNTAGNYLDTLQAANGCDSVVTLTLNVLPTSTGAFTQTICSNETFTFNGATLNTAGTYKDTLTSANGCDSVVTLTLVVNSTKATSLNQSICQGSSFTFNGQTLTAAGTYKDTLTSATGCDSVITLNLTVNPLPTKPVITQAGNVLTCSVTASAYQWSLNASTISGATGKQYTITQSGPYTVQVTDANGCKNTSDVFNGIVTAIENIDGTSFDCSVYPNPNNGKFTVLVSNDKASDVQITCHNVIGEIVYTGDFQMNNGQLKTELDLTTVAKGVYIVNVKANGKTTYRKITIAE
jgi:hypothetical protein